MAKAIRAHNPGATVAIALLAALLLLVAVTFVVWQVATTGDHAGTPATSADRAGESSLTRDPYIDRHAEIVARYQKEGLR